MDGKKKIGLAVSGGADSTALLVLMSELREEFNFDAVVLHVDHNLREDSAADAKFVKALAKQFGLPFYSHKANIVRQKRESIEMAARRVRLEFFAKMMKKLNLTAIATGHHDDDVAELFLMRLARGSGADGLAGLKSVSQVNGITFIRPLLNVRDTQLRDFLSSRNISWREDSTNTDTSIFRNKVRHVILPFLREHLDAHITDHICKSAAILRGDISRIPPSTHHYPLSTNHYPLTTNHYSLTITEAVGYKRNKESIFTLPAECYLSREALKNRKLELRPWQAGDRIAPVGMNGHSRKLQDIFVTEKVPQHLRKSIPILVDAETNEVLWIPGYRIATSVAVKDQSSPSWHLKMLVPCIQ